MRLVQIHASKDEDADCVMRELAAYGPRRSRRSVLIDLGEPSKPDLLSLLFALETCVSDNGIRSVRLELDGRKYFLAPV